MTTTEKSNPAPTYRVVMPMIQILGHTPFSGSHAVPDRSLYRGDIVPTWVPDEEVQRLLAGGFLEEIS